MRWICRDCHNPTNGGWCSQCNRNTGVFTSADFGPPRAPQPKETLSKAEIDSAVELLVKRFGGIDPAS